MVDLAPSTLERIDRYWAGFFGYSSAMLHSGRTVVGPDTEPNVRPGMFMLVRGQSVLVAVSPDHLEALQPIVQNLSPAQALDAAYLAALLGDQVERFVGPAFTGYADRDTFRAVDHDHACLLGVEDAAAHARLQAACDPVEWEHGGSALDHPVAGVKVDGELVAIAGYEVWGDDLAHIAIITHPQHRGHGYGRAAASRIAAGALDHDLAPQYRTLASNTPSIIIARALGFVPYAYTMAVRFKR